MSPAGQTTRPRKNVSGLWPNSLAILKEPTTSRAILLYIYRAVTAPILLLTTALAPSASAFAGGHRAAAPVRPLTYVAIGASDAYGVGADDPASESWPAVLDAMLPRGSRLVNLGVPGITLARALDIELPVALDALPGRCAARKNSGCAGSRSVVTVWLAVNDLRAGASLRSYGANLHTLLRALRLRTGAAVLVGNVPDLAALPSFRGQGPALAATVAAWNKAIAATAHQDGATLVDLYAGWRELAAHPEYVGADGLHPTAAGYHRLAEIFYRGLEGLGR